MQPLMLGMGQQEIAVIFIVFLFLMVFLPIFLTILARFTRGPGDDERDPPKKQRR